MAFVKSAMSWLSRTARDPPFWVFIVLLPLLVFFCRKLGHGGIYFLKVYWPDLLSSSTVVTYSAQIQSSGLEGMVFKHFILVPFREELLYRFLPFVSLWWAWRAWRKEAPPLLAAVFLILITSTWFGYIHGGVGNILIHGPMGVLFALVYLAMSAYGKKPLLGLFCAVVFHGSYNFSVALLKYLSLSGQ